MFSVTQLRAVTQIFSFKTKTLHSVLSLPTNPLITFPFHCAVNQFAQKWHFLDKNSSPLSELGFIICLRIDIQSEWQNKSKIHSLFLVSSRIWMCSMFFLYVRLKRMGLTAGKATVTTFEGLFSSMLALVSFQNARLNCRKVAQITLERLFSWMNPCVYLQITSCFAGVDT